MRLATQPVHIELNGTGFGVGGGDQGKFDLVCTCVKHCEDVDFVLAFSSDGIILDLYCPWACAIDMHLFKGVPIMQGQDHGQEAVVGFPSDFVPLALVE